MFGFDSSLWDIQELAMFIIGASLIAPGDDGGGEQALGVLLLPKAHNSRKSERDRYIATAAAAVRLTLSPIRLAK